MLGEPIIDYPFEYMATKRGQTTTALLIQNMAMLIVLFCLHAFDLVSTLERQDIIITSKPTLEDALVSNDCSAVRNLSTDLFKESTEFPSFISAHFNAGNMACWSSVLDAYYDVLIRPDWVNPQSPYKGKLTESAPVPEKSYPMAELNSNGHTEILQITGQSKSSVSMKRAHTNNGKAWNFGEDAVGRSEDKQFYVVADGVGGASHSEVVSFAMAYLSVFMYEESKFDLLAASFSLIDALQLFLKRARLSGSTTLLLGRISKDKSTLQVVNIGDCVAMVHDANGQVKFLSNEQWWAPNTPYQLNYNSQFMSRLADRYSVKLESKDTVLLYSDGIADNVWPMQIARTRSAAHLLQVALQQARGSIGTDIPFSEKMGMQLYGKMDDMTIVRLVI